MVEYETDANDLFYVRIDKNRKIFITTFLRALGLGTDDEIREFFGNDERIEATIEKDTTKNTEEALIEVYKKLRPGELPPLKQLRLILTDFSLIRTDMTFQESADINTTKSLPSATDLSAALLHSLSSHHRANSLPMRARRSIKKRPLR